MLDKHKTPELIHEPLIEEALRTIQSAVFRIAQALERIETQIRQLGRVNMDLTTDPEQALIALVRMPPAKGH